jgi:hypothetical protein
MALPDRPVAAAAIETDWGQAVHDYTFAPSGCKVHGATNHTVGTSASTMALGVADDDPGGYLNAANNRVVVPTGREGLYSCFVQVRTVNGSIGAGFGTRSFLRRNGTDIASGKEDNEGGVNITFTLTWTGDLSAGDILQVVVQRLGAGTSPDVTIDSLVLYRIGAELGA